jgi:8-oxo-dGTP pyrophosphatase MutT (NUDIX family)
VHEAAARREVFEETGFVLNGLGPVVHRRRAEVEFMDRTITADENYFVVRCERRESSTAGWTELERTVMEEHRWWTTAELRTTTETVYPENLIWLIETFG